jgi:hypothetical protein
LKRGEYRLKTHYTNLAGNLIDLAQGQIIRLYAHSLGGIEALDLVKALARHENLPHKSLEIIFISPPGIGQKGVIGMQEVGRRFVKLVRNLGLYDQYHILPMSVSDEKLTPKKSQVFLEEWLPCLVTNEAKRAKFAQTLAVIDGELHFLQKRPDLQKKYELWYRKQRHKLMKPLLEKVLYGSHIKEEIHQQFLQRYREMVQDKAPRFIRFPLTFAFAAKALKTMYQGVDSKILEISEYCQQLGVTATLGVVILGKDDLVRATDYAKLDRLSFLRQITIHHQIFDEDEHASVAYKWELIDALEAIQFPV